MENDEIHSLDGILRLHSRQEGKGPMNLLVTKPNTRTAGGGSPLGRLSMLLPDSLCENVQFFRHGPDATIIPIVSEGRSTLHSGHVDFRARKSLLHV